MLLLWGSDGVSKYFGKRVVGLKQLKSLVKGKNLRLYFQEEEIIDIDSHITPGTGGGKIMQPFKIMSKPYESEKLIEHQVNFL